MERVFGAGKVFDQYGAREMYVASECREHAGYHVHAEVVIVEVVDSNDRPCAPGERGRVLVTDLSNHAFPFVRYEVGDVAVAGAPEPCACGVTLPRLQRIEGRVSDLVVLRDRILTAPGFCHLFTAVDGVRSFQVRQDASDRIRVLIDPGPEYDADVEAFLMRSLEEMVESSARVEIVTSEPITIPASGKRRFVISDVAPEAL
jgi:phenylacetate-CoA ligase